MLSITVFPRHSNESVRSWIYRVILEAIVHLELKPTAMMDIGELQATFGASRTPIREAMVQLAQEGFVKLLPQRGSYVAPFDLEEVEKARFIRLCLEKEVLVRACACCDAATYRALRYILDNQGDAIAARDDRRLYELDEKFHMTYYAACKRENVWAYLHSTNLHFYRLRVLNITIQDMRKFTYRNHEELYDALVRRDAGAAVSIIESHLDIGTWGVMELVEKTPEWFVRHDGSAMWGAGSRGQGNGSAVGLSELAPR